jgi:hypothetical protein
MVDRYGTPFSAALHVAERYRLIDGTSARDRSKITKAFVSVPENRAHPPIPAHHG